MRLRTKLLCFLLVLVLPPLLAVSFYALRQGRRMGDDLARQAGMTFAASATRELALMVELIGEDISDNRQMLELSLSFLARETTQALTPQLNPVFSQVATAAYGPSGPAAKHPDPKPASHPSRNLSFLTPEGGTTGAQTEAGKRLARLLPTMRLLGDKLHDTMLWVYVALPDGLMCTYPATEDIPKGYDPRTRPWYTAALRTKGPVWSILVDAKTGQLTATISTAVRDHEGTLLGVAALDAPLASLLPESDLSKRWGEGVLARIVHIQDSPQGPKVMVLGSRDFIAASHGWQAPVTPTPLNSPNMANLRRLADDILEKKSDQLPLELDGNKYFAVFKPFPDTEAGLLVLVPRHTVLAQASLAESTILDRTQSMLSIVVGFALLAVITAVVMAIFGARAVTQPVTALCAAVGRLAEGDLTARAKVTGHDELGELALAFNTMAPKLAERLRLKQDLMLAMEVQQNLLPKAPPTMPGLSIAGATSFCDETGGDYFDYLSFEPRLGAGCDVAIGDATGHGIAAALFMATGRALLRAGRGCDPGPAALLSLVNGLLCQDTMDSGRFLTLFYLRLEGGGLGPEGRLTWSRAGHDPALIYDPATDGFQELLGPGLPLGVLPDYAYEEQSHPGLVPGQVLALGTDGIWEARNPAGEMYGKDRFREVLRRHAAADAATILDAVQSDVAAFQGGCPRNDDITLVVIKALAGEEEQPPVTGKG